MAYDKNGFNEDGYNQDGFDKYGNSRPTTPTNNPGSITISGTTKQGQQLTALVEDTDGKPNSISYQWLQDGNVISGATQSNYTLTEGDVGKTISVKASYTDGKNNAENVTSNPTEVIEKSTTSTIPISNATNPVKQIHEIGSFDTQGIATALAVKNNMVFLADSEDGLRIIDVTNPANPIEIGFYDTAGSVQDVAVSGSLAYIADREQGLQLLDVSDNRNPKLIGSGFVIPNGESAEGVTIVDNKAFVRFLNSLEIIDVSDPYNLKSLAKIEYFQGMKSGSIKAITIKDNILFACCDSIKSAGVPELKLFDISNPSNPRFVTSYSLTKGSVNNMVISDNHAFITYNGFDGIDILDVTDIQDIRILGHSNIWTKGVSVSSNNVVSASGPFVDLLNVENLNNPKFLQELEINHSDTGSSLDKGHAVDVEISGDYAYVADSRGGLKIIELISKSVDTPTPDSMLDSGESSSSVLPSVTDQKILPLTEGLGDDTVDGGNDNDKILGGNSTEPSIPSKVQATTLSDVITSFVFLSASDMTYKVSNSSSKIFGSNGNQTLLFDSDVFNVLLDSNVEHLVFNGSISSYLFKQSGVNLNIYDGNSILVASIGLQDDDNGTELSFADGKFNAEFFPTQSGLDLTVGGNAINNEIPEMISTIGVSSF